MAYGMRILLVLAAGLAAFFPTGEAAACTMVAPPPGVPSEAEMDRRAGEVWAWSRVALEVEVVRAAGRQEGLVRVLRAFKGPHREGAILRALPLGNAACGPDRLVVGTRGLILLGEEPPRGQPIRIPYFVEADLRGALERQALVGPGVR